MKCSFENQEPVICMKTLDYKLLLLLLLPNMQSKLHNFGDAVEPFCVFLSPTEKKHFLPSDRECLFFLPCNTYSSHRQDGTIMLHHFLSPFSLTLGFL